VHVEARDPNRDGARVVRGVHFNVGGDRADGYADNDHTDVDDFRRGNESSCGPLGRPRAAADVGAGHGPRVSGRRGRAGRCGGPDTGRELRAVGGSPGCAQERSGRRAASDQIA
jgi:hypothetical protein